MNFYYLFRHLAYLVDANGYVLEECFASLLCLLPIEQATRFVAKHWLTYVEMMETHAVPIPAFVRQKLEVAVRYESIWVPWPEDDAIVGLARLPAFYALEDALNTLNSLACLAFAPDAAYQSLMRIVKTIPGALAALHIALSMPVDYQSQMKIFDMSNEITEAQNRGEALSEETKEMLERARYIQINIEFPFRTRAWRVLLADLEIVLQTNPIA